MLVRYSAILPFLLVTLLTLSSVANATTLNVYVDSRERPKVMHEIFAIYERSHPNIEIHLQQGAATSAKQQQYLSTLLAGKSPKLDVIFTDITRPAQYASAHWALPLNKYLSASGKSLLSPYLKVYADADDYKGETVALPGWADAMFLYYRKDLLDKYNLSVPKTWKQLQQDADVITKGENNPNLQGFSFQGAAIEGTVCTFLIPFWELGGTVINKDGSVGVDTPAGRHALKFLKNTIYKSGIAPKNTSQVVTDATRKAFQAGNVVFAINWAYAWSHFQEAGSTVKGKVGVVRLPTFQGHKHQTCIGGYQWVASAYSRHKQEAADLVKFLASKKISRIISIKESNLPVYPSLYKDPKVLRVDPWFKLALPVVETARSRPATPNYSQVSDVIRSNVNAVLAGQEAISTALKTMQDKLEAILGG